MIGKCNTGGGENLTTQLNNQDAIITELEAKVQSVSAVDMITPVNEQTLTIQDIQEALVGKAAVNQVELTVTPGKDSQEYVPENGNTYSKVTVNGDADLVPENIVKNIEIFGVTGNHQAPEYGILYNTIDSNGNPTDITYRMETWGQSSLKGRSLETKYCKKVLIDFPQLLNSEFDNTFSGFGGKLKLKRVRIIQGTVFSYFAKNVDTSILDEADRKMAMWVPNTCEEFRGNISSSTMMPLYGANPDAKIYCEAASRPDAWYGYWNFYDTSYNALTVVWGVTEEQFDAL